MEPIRIDVWSDIACPWCYIGKRRLEAGMAAFAAEPGTPPVEVEYHSFQLAPETPVDFDGSETEFLMGYKGIPEQVARQMIDNVVGVARDVGLAYDYDLIRHTNTVKAHQLVHYAKAHDRQGDMKERLMHAYWIEGLHIGHAYGLVALAAEVGLDADDVRRSLDEDEYLDAVRADEAQARAYGITGVPTFVIDGRYAISGAQSEELFVQALRRVTDERASA